MFFLFSSENLNSQQLRSGIIIAIIIASMFLAVVAPHALSWFVWALPIALACFFIQSDLKIGSLQNMREARVVGFLLCVFIVFLFMRAATSKQPMYAFITITSFVIPIIGTALGLFLMRKFTPEGRWCWLFIVFVQVGFGIALACIVYYFSALMQIRPVSFRHEAPYHYNRLAVFLSLSSPIGYHSILCGIQSNVTRRVAVVAFFFTIGTCLAVSESESAKLVFLVVAAVYAFAFWKLHFASLLTAFLVVAGTLSAPIAFRIVFDALREGLRIENFGENSFTARLIIWRSNSDLIDTASLFGRGIEYFRHFGGFHPITGQHFIESHAHSYVFQIWLDCGLIGALLLCALLAQCILLTRNLPKREGALMLSLFAGMILVWAVSHGIWQAWYMGICGMILNAGLLYANRSIFEKIEIDVAPAP